MKSVKRPHIVLLADMEDHSAREACLGAAQYAAEANLSLEPWSVAGRNTPKPSEFKGIDGLILTGSACDRVFANGSKPNIPCVFILNKATWPNVPTVTFDEEAIGVMAAEHLIHRGYTKLVSFASLVSDWARGRVAGFKKECLRQKITPDHFQLPEDVLPSYWQRHSLQANQKLQSLLKSLPKSTGIFAVNDVAACYIIEAARNCGIKVPQEIGVVGADDDLIPNAASGLSISSVEPPFRLLGNQAANILDQLRNRKNPPLLTLLPPIRIIVRTSTNDFMVDSPLVRRAQAYIEEHRQGAVRISDVARAAGTTTVTLGKNFRTHMAMTPSEYVLQRRIEYAKELLRSGKHNVEEVSSICGFHSSSYFCMIFKKITARTPGWFRP
jgi:LacI family transcriptional regulator